MKYKEIRKILLFLLTSVLIIGCVNFLKLSDLRPNDYNFPNHQKKAQELIQEMASAHNSHMWDSIETYSVILRDEFYGFFGKQAHPFPEQEMQFTLSYIPKSTEGRLKIMNGNKKGETWGIQSWDTYKLNTNEDPILTENKDLKFWIPTYQYFIELPNRIQEATAIDYIGQKIINGVETEGVLASWNTVKPQNNIDQYVLWIDSKTKRLVKVEYTVRDFYKFITGAAYYENYKDFDGFLLPTEMPVESNLVKDGLLHKMSIINFERDPIEKNKLLPFNINKNKK